MATMIEIQNTLTDKGFEMLGQACVGVYNSYAMSISQAANGFHTLDVAVRLNKKDTRAGAIQRTLKSARPFRVGGVVNKGDSLNLTVRFDKKTPVDQQLPVLLSQTVSVLRDNGIAPADTCAVCGRTLPESMALLTGWQPVHAGCVRNLVHMAENAAEENRLHGSYLLGIIGAVLGMFVGMIPNILTIVFLDMVVAILFALVPLASMWGYRKLGGKMNRVSLVIVIILSLVSALLMTAISAAFSLAQEYGIPFFDILPSILAYVVTAEGFVALLQDGLIPLIFMALGIWIAWRFLNRTSDDSIHDASAAAATLRPNPAYMTAAAYPTSPTEPGGN